MSRHPNSKTALVVERGRRGAVTLSGGGGGAGVGRGGEPRVSKQLMKQMPAAFRDILLLLHSPVLH